MSVQGLGRRFLRQVRRRAVKLALLGLLDQAISSLTNFAATFVGFVTFSAAGFGAFSIAIAWYAITVGITRGLVTEPQAIRYAASESTEWRRVTAEAAGSAFIVGLIAAIGLSIGALFLNDQVARPVLALALFLPALVLQDSYRMSFIVSGRYKRALINDSVWALCLVPGLAALLAAESFEPTALVVAWAAAGAVAAAVGMVQGRAAPHLGALRGWLRREGSLAYRFAAEFAIQRGSYELALILILVVSDLEVVGSIAGARFLFAPLTVAFLTAQVVGIPEMVRLRDKSMETFNRASVILIVVLTALGLVAGAFIWLLRDLVEAVVGTGWDDLVGLLLPMSIFVSTGGAILGATVVMRALAAAKESVRAAALAAVAVVVCAPVLAAMGGAAEAAWGLAIGGAIGMVIWIGLAIVASRRPFRDATVA